MRVSLQEIETETEREVEAIFSTSGEGEIMEEIKRVAKRLRATSREE